MRGSAAAEQVLGSKAEGQVVPFRHSRICLLGKELRSQDLVKGSGIYFLWPVRGLPWQAMIHLNFLFSPSLPFLMSLILSAVPPSLPPPKKKSSNDDFNSLANLRPALVGLPL